MKILALEFSSPVRSVAVGGSVGKRGYAEEAGSRESKPFTLIDAALAQAGISREEIECIAVGLGPGSYAGIRIAIAIAQGWQLARRVKLLGISSAEVVAAHAGRAGVKDLFIGVEGRRGELYVARYDASAFDAPQLMDPFRVVSAIESSALSILRMDGPAGLESSHGIPKANMLAEIAAGRTDFLPGHALEPIYLREPEFVKAPPPRFPLL
jgi:tRNA threonylcarbamoyl adenosine modification protein YeaZ